VQLARRARRMIVSGLGGGALQRSLQRFGAAIRRTGIIEVVDGEAPEPYRPAKLPATWNDRDRIAVHRDLPPSERVRLTIEASRATLRFARGRRVDAR
jgi:hypothetical protein